MWKHVVTTVRFEDCRERCFCSLSACHCERNYLILGIQTIADDGRVFGAPASSFAHVRVHFRNLQQQLYQRMETSAQSHQQIYDLILGNQPLDSLGLQLD